jgi:hypothetical protein
MKEDPDVDGGKIPDGDRGFLDPSTIVTVTLPRLDLVSLILSLSRRSLTILVLSVSLRELDLSLLEILSLSGANVFLGLISFGSFIWGFLLTCQVIYSDFHFPFFLFHPLGVVLEVLCKFDAPTASLILILKVSTCGVES